MLWPSSTYFTTNSRKNSSYSTVHLPFLSLSHPFTMFRKTIVAISAFCIKKENIYVSTKSTFLLYSRSLWSYWRAKNVCYLLKHLSIFANFVIQNCCMLFWKCKRTLFIHNMTFTATAIKFYLKDYPFKEELMFTVTVCQFECNRRSL